jgi:hypothetical protein
METKARKLQEAYAAMKAADTAYWDASGTDRMRDTATAFIAAHKQFRAAIDEEAVSELLEAQRWVPVEEQLPDKTDDDYEVTLDAGNGLYVTHAGWTGERWRVPRNIRVLAWRPLPEPYRAPTEGVE